MRRMAACVVTAAAALSFLGLAATSASANPKLELTHDVTPFAVGEGLTSFISEQGSVPKGGATTIETNPGTVTCPGESAGIVGKVQSNKLVTDKVSSEAPFGNLNAEVFEHISPRCPNTTSLGEYALVTLSTHGGPLLLTGYTGKAILKGPTTADPLGLEIAYSGGTTCRYTRMSFVGALKFEPSFEPYSAKGLSELNIVFTKQKVKLVSGSPPACPTTVSVTAQFGTQGHAVGGGAYEYVFGRLI